MASLPLVEIYTDGGCDPNPGTGGWGAVLLYGNQRQELSGAKRNTTNNRMELTAAIEALRHLNRRCRVVVYTDSRYLRRGITRWIDQWQASGWETSRGRRVKNQDLWRALLEQTERHEIDWHWLKGHAGHPENNRADQLASQALKRLRRSHDGGREDEEDEVDLPLVEIVTRACALGNPGPAGYAAIVQEEGQEPVVASGSWPMASNNVMELWAVVAGLRTLTDRSRVIVKTASKYVLDGAQHWLPGWEKRGWRTKSGKAVKHQEIWGELTNLMGDHYVQWEYLPSDSSQISSRAYSIARREAEAQPDKQQSGTA